MGHYAPAFHIKKENVRLYDIQIGNLTHQNETKIETIAANCIDALNEVWNKVNPWTKKLSYFLLQ